MTRIELLQQKVDQLEEKLKLANDVRRDIESQKIDQLSRKYTEYFKEVLEHGDTIKVSNDRVEFTRPKEGHNYNKEVLNLYFRSKDWREEEVDEIRTSFYSTTGNDEFELRRMILIGKVGQIVLDFYDDILAAYNQVQEQFKDALKEQRKEIYGIEKEVYDLKNQIEEIEKENLLEKVEKQGIEFKLPEGESYHRYPNFEAKWDWTIFNIKGLKIVKKTLSGKSADLEVKTISRVWNTDTQSYNEEEQSRVIEKVRMDKIERFLQINSERIVTS